MVVCSDSLAFYLICGPIHACIIHVCEVLLFVFSIIVQFAVVVLRVGGLFS